MTRLNAIIKYANYIQRKDTSHKTEFIYSFHFFQKKFQVIDRDIPFIFASILAENGATLIPQEEGFRYTLQRFHSIFPNRKFSSDPHKLAEIMYSGRLGNEHEGDAWRYRGRGYFQVTGKANYNMIDEVCKKRLSFKMGYSLFPELLLTPAHATVSMLAFYWANLRGASDFREFTKKLTGGEWDLKRRYKILENLNKEISE